MCVWGGPFTVTAKWFAKYVGNGWPFFLSVFTLAPFPVNTTVPGHTASRGELNPAHISPNAVLFRAGIAFLLSLPQGSTPKVEPNANPTQAPPPGSIAKSASESHSAVKGKGKRAGKGKGGTKEVILLFVF